MDLAQMAARNYPYTRLFSPIQVNRLTLKNRIVMGPMGNISMAEEMGRPTNKMVQYFAERAKGGAGLLTSGLVPISQAVDPTVTERGDKSYFPRIDSSRTVFAGWRDLAESVHAYGSRFFIQLTAGLGRVGSPESLLTKYKMPVSASWNPNFYIPAIPCRPMTDGECRTILKAAGQGAADAKAATIDGVYLHGHEGYLLEQMTNPAFNRRLFGRYANWQNFGLDMVKEIRKRVGPHFPIMYRIDLSLALNETYGKRMEDVTSLKSFQKERTVTQTLDYMVNLVKAGVDLFDVDLGCYDNWWLPHPPNSMPSGCFLAVSRLVKEYFEHEKVISNAGLPVPVVAVGKLGYPDLAEQALRDGDCDMIMLARPLLADSEWPNKAYAGRVMDIRPCIGDQEACINEFVEGGHPQCSVNPRTGFEDVFDREVKPAMTAKKVAVVGAGPSGIVCAITAAQRGHKVTLYEKSNKVGGMLVPGSVPKIKYEVKNYLAYLEYQLEKTSKNFDLTVNLSQDISPDELKNKDFDTIIVSVGGSAVTPKLPGIDADFVVQAIDLLKNPELAANAQKIAVIGAGAVGCEAAHYLASELKKTVTVIEMLPTIMPGLCTANRGHLIHALEKLAVPLWNCTKLKSIENGKITLLRNVSNTVPDPFNTWTPILPENIHNPFSKAIVEDIKEIDLETDLVVLAMGLKPGRDYYESCIKAQAAPEIIQLGDSFQIGRVFEAVKSGSMVGRNL
ncbi:MAG: FAD-dependent oxidoreductase [Anaerolineae bacterium]|nr:FAD-dependent oxidoreductase [Anaerolineae bacterium]